MNRLQFIAAALLFAVSATAADGFSVAAFTCDATPPLGHPLCGGWIKPLEFVDDPLLAKGVVLSDGKTRYVLCSVDWCRIQGAAHDMICRKIARALDIPVSQVAVQTVHQHNAPLSDINAELLLEKCEKPPRNLDLNFYNQFTDRVASAAKEASRALTPATHIGFGKAKVEDFASNRRVKMPDGKIFVRTSSHKSPIAREAPEGVIDPWLRTITFFNEEAPLVRLHYYASHPMSYYGDGHGTADTVGIARAQLEKEEGITHIYFTGCAGDITAGKYNTGTPKERAALADRLLAGMKFSIASSSRAPLTEMKWSATEVVFTPRTEREFSVEKMREKMENPDEKNVGRIVSALNLAWYDRVKSRPAVTINGLKMGRVRIFNLPGEAFIEYQLFAQRILPDDFVAVASYGDGGPGYICVDAAIAEGGYEPTMSLTGLGSEQALKDGITRLAEPDKKIPTRLPRETQLVFERDGKILTVKSIQDWQERRDFTKRAMQQIVGAYPHAQKTARTPLKVKVDSETDCGSYVRRLLTYSDSVSTVPAYLLIPKAALNSTRHDFPAVLCLHQTNSKLGHDVVVGLGKNPNDSYAAELAERGYVTLAPSYPLLAKYQPDLRAENFQSGTMKAISDNSLGLDLLESLPFVRPGKFGTIGHSLGGHNSVFTAVFDERIKVVVSSCGLDAFNDYYNADDKNWMPERGWCQTRYMPRLSEFRGRLNEIPFDFHELIACLAPRHVLISAPLHDTNFRADSVDRIGAAAKQIFELYGCAKNLQIEHPDCGHDFPKEMREKTYALFDQVLK